MNEPATGLWSAEPDRPWGVTVATFLLLSSAAASLASAGLTLVVFIPKIGNDQRLRAATGISGPDARWTVAAAVVTVVLGVGVVALAMSALRGKAAAYPLLLCVTVLVLPSAWCWGTGGEVARQWAPLEWTDGCGDYYSLKSWYMEQWMPVLAMIESVAWLIGMIVLLLAVPQRFWSTRLWGLQ